MRLANGGPKKTSIIRHLGCGGHRASRAGGSGGCLLDRQDGGQAFDVIDVRSANLLKGLTSLGREALDVFPVSLGSKHIKDQRRFPGTAHPGNADQLAPRKFRHNIL